LRFPFRTPRRLNLSKRLAEDSSTEYAFRVKSLYHKVSGIASNSNRKENGRDLYRAFLIALSVQHNGARRRQKLSQRALIEHIVGTHVFTREQLSPQHDPAPEAAVLAYAVLTY